MLFFTVVSPCWIFLRQRDGVPSGLFQVVAMLPRPVLCAVESLRFNMREQLEADGRCSASDALSECHRRWLLAEQRRGPAREGSWRGQRRS